MKCIRVLLAIRFTGRMHAHSHPKSCDIHNNNDTYELLATTGATLAYREHSDSEDTFLRAVACESIQGRIEEAWCCGLELHFHKTRMAWC